MLTCQEKLKSISYQLHQTKKQLFQLENFTDNYTDILRSRNKYFSSPSNTQNQIIHLSDIAKNLPQLAQSTRKNKKRQIKL